MTKNLKADPFLIKNPFIVNTIAGVRLSPDKDPREHKNKIVKYVSQYKLPSGNIALINPVDDKLNYIIGKNEEKEYTDLSKYDYFVDAETLNKNRTDGKTPHKEGVPYSFLQITNEEDGIEWYREHYPKIPEELLPIIARYNWGEPITKKNVKNEKKKILKKADKEIKGLQMRTGNFQVTFNYNNFIKIHNFKNICFIYKYVCCCWKKI